MAKDKFDVLLLRPDQSVARATFCNTPAGFKKLLLWLRRQEVSNLRACMEATGRFGEPLAHFLHRHQVELSVVNPLIIHHFARSEMSRNKTDAHDAWLIARYSQLKLPRLWQPLSPERQNLKQQVRLRDQLVEHRASLQRQRQDAPRFARKYFSAQLRLLNRQVREVEQQIAKSLQSDPGLTQDAALLQSIPGLGRITAAAILAWMPPRTELASARQLAAYAGVTPQQRQSGTAKGKTRLSKIGHGLLRKSLYFPAITALRCNSTVKALARRLAQKGKSPMVIIGAAMRMLLHLAYGVLKTQKPFDPAHQNAGASKLNQQQAAASPQLAPAAAKLYP